MSSSTWSRSRLLLGLVISTLVATRTVIAARNISGWELGRQNVSYVFTDSSSLGAFTRPPRGPQDECPPCFNCLLPNNQCGQYGECDKFDGQCKCPPGWAGIDCLIPQCGALKDGERRVPRNDGETCECSDGWTGINCNVCEADLACAGFPIPGIPDLPDDDDGLERNMTCHKNGPPIFSNYQMCDVTNPGILELLPDRPPQVTFSCDKAAATCLFQFWVDQVESFYCALDQCTSSLQSDIGGNKTSYKCDKLSCSCVKDRFLCGENGSIDLHEFFDEEIKGPAQFECKAGQGCTFKENAMDTLIDEIFGDPWISLKCQGGECLHYSQVPGYVAPLKPSNKWVVLSTAGAITAVLLVSLVLWYAGRDYTHGSHIKLPESEAAKLMSEHVPAALHFSNISYNIGSRTILDNINGTVKPGQVMAIMGASGAGKSTFLDIIARKEKRGVVGGQTLVNGREVSDSDFKRVMGFVDQEDTLMRTLTVYETVLYSALLRLPRDMSLEAKKFRTLETMQELGILGIRDSRIGDSGRRSISGGEKRRVSIACELVTSPSILFLDEPTSGLDAYNAYNVIDSLVNLAQNYKRTVVFTIHQPRSNIVAMFDQLVLLAHGKCVYSGPMSQCQGYFEDVGYPCPAGFNIADYLIDLTTKASLTPRSESPVIASSSSQASRDRENNLGNEEQGLSTTMQSERSDETELQTRPNSVNTENSTSEEGLLKRKTSQLIEAVANFSGGTYSPRKNELQLSPLLTSLVTSYASSNVAKEMKAEAETAAVASRTTGGQLPDVAEEDGMLRGRKGASWATQFRILSGRAFKNLYRDPALLGAHYAFSIALALICGFFYRNIKNDIPGFQNRLGLFFFSLSLFGFSSLTTLSLFANERLLFMRERANGYYTSFTYFSSKILFDILPLRIVPPLVFGAIVYPLVGLVPNVVIFWKFLLTLVLFNLSTASAVLLISITFANGSVANLVGTLVMLFNLLFAGLLVNRATLGAWAWLLYASFYHAAYEALAVNELQHLHLKENKYGVDLDVPAATILSAFGFRAQAFWWPDIAALGIFFGGFTVLSWVVLHFYVREKR